MFSTLPGADLRVIPSLALATLVCMLLLTDRAYVTQTTTGSRDPSFKTLTAVYVALLSVAIGVGMLLLVRGALRCINPAQWHDARSFWAWGRMVWAGSDPYSTTTWRQFFGPGTPPHEIAIDMNAGSAYPPPTHLLFATMGRLAFQPAMVFWEVLQFAAMLVSAWLLARTLLRDRGAFAFPLAFAIIVLLPGTGFTFDQGQINFLAFVAILLAWRDRQKARAGIWIACATCVKPIYHIYWLYPLIRKHWRMLITGAAGVVVTAIISVVVLGPHHFTEYFTSSPIARLDPNAAFIPFGNQSLLSTILRFAPERIAYETPLFDPIYLGIAAVVFLMTAWVMMRTPRSEEGDAYTFILTVPTALLLYPGTLANYSVLLALPVLALWKWHALRASRAELLAVLIGLVYGVMCLQHGDFTIIANIGLWVIVMLATLGVPRSASA